MLLFAESVENATPRKSGQSECARGGSLWSEGAAVHAAKGMEVSLGIKGEFCLRLLSPVALSVG